MPHTPAHAAEPAHPTLTYYAAAARLYGLAERLEAQGLEVTVSLDRRMITAIQPAAAPAVDDTCDTTPPRVGLSQVVYLAARTVRGVRQPYAWVARFDDGFRGARRELEPIAAGDDLDQAAAVIGRILALLPDAAASIPRQAAAS